MPLDPCEPCNCPEQFSRSTDGYRAAVLQILCQILEGGGGGGGGIVRYDWEVLCDPDTDAAVLLRFEYDTDGNVVGVEGFNPDGTAYAGDLGDLVPCGTSLGAHAEDSPATTGDFGFSVLGVRQDTPAVLTDASGDYSWVATNQAGAVKAELDVRFNNTTSPDSSPVKLNDHAYASGIVGIIGMGRAAESSPTQIVTSTGRACVFSTTTRGSLYVSMTNLNGEDQERSLLKTPGSGATLAGHSAGVMGVSVSVATPTTAIDASQVLRPIKSNLLGALYNDPAHAEVDFLSGSLAFGSVAEASFAVLVANAGSDKGRSLVVMNRLDRDVALSFDGAADQWFVPQNGDVTLDLAANGRWATTDLEVRALVSDPTAGTIFAAIMI